MTAVLTLHDLFVRHGGMPEGGFPLEDVYAMNRMTPGEWRRAVDDAREARSAALGEAAVSEDERRADELRAATLASGVPERYASVAVDSRRVGDMASGRGLWLHGDVGTGKTTAACSALRGWLASGRRGAFVTSVAMLSELRDSMTRRDEVASTSRYATVGLLVLDDLDKEPPTARSLSKLFGVVDARWASSRPTVVTSQLAPSEIGARLAAGGDEATATAIVSRLVGSCVTMRMGGRDMRRA